MKKYLALTFFFFLLIAGCSNDPVSPPEVNKSGSILFKIDRLNAPSNVQTVTAILSRNGFENISSTMNLLSDTTADLELINIPAGTWHLVVNAKDSLGTVVYTGETNVNIIESMTIQVSLTLMPVSLGTGNIYIFVTWGSNLNLNWVDYTGNPVLTKYNCPGNPLKVAECKVIFDDGKYKMWYNAVFPSVVAKIYYAESIDGKNWVHPVQTPVLSTSVNSWDSYGVGVGAVIKDNGTYRMFYSGWDNNYTQSIGLANSTDGINWTKVSGPVITGLNGNKAAPQSGFKFNNVYYLYFSEVNDLNNNYVNVAVSQNLTQWEIVRNIITPDEVWEAGQVCYPSVIKESNQFKMIFQNSLESAFGEATSTDGLTWIKSCNNPVVTRTQVANQWCTAICYPNFMVNGNTYRIYYSGTVGYHTDYIGFFEKRNQ
jgi:hypothetical protein